MRWLRRPESVSRAAGVGLAHGLALGIHAGLVVTSSVHMGEDVSIVGDVSRIAVMLQDNAEPGSIQISAATAALLGDAFVLADRGPIEVKGIGPVQTAFLEGRRTPPERG